jgi:hypothetical protein
VYSGKYNLDFHHSRAELLCKERSVQICIVRRQIVERITPPWSDRVLVRGRVSIVNMIWMKIADEDSASSIQVKDIGA